jgi:glycosyltransferase involved in cell wall biosynthesis
MKTLVFETLWANPADGWSIAARAYTRAMLLAGWDVRLKSPVQIFTDSSPDEIKKYLPLTRPTSSWDAYIFSCPLGGPDNMRHIFEALALTRRPRLFYTMFERVAVEAVMAGWLSGLEGVFVPCEKNGARLVAAGMNDVGVIPLPFFDDDPHLNLPPPREHPEVFAWHGRWEPRKAPDRLLRAFMRAFKYGDAELILKIGSAPWTRTVYPAPEFVIVNELAGDETRRNGWNVSNWHQAITIIDETLSEQEMLEMEARTDVYATASRGEGIDLPAFRARLAGRRVVTPASGGPEDFLDEDDVLIQATGTIGAPEYASIWGEGASLIDYPLGDLVWALREAKDRPLKKRALPEAHRPEAVVVKFNEWIERCLHAL